MNRIALIVVILTASPLAIAQSAPPSTRPSGATTAPGDMRFMSSDQVFDQMLKPATRPSKQLTPLPEQPVRDTKSGSGSLKPNAPPVVLVREGTMIVDRLGRVSHTENGQAEFTFESDGKALRDPPMLLMPNLMLNQIEDQITAWNRDLKLRVTGVVYEYKGRNYLLLEKVIVPLDVTQQF
jgi:hypothetical protein